MNKILTLAALLFCSNAFSAMVDMPTWDKNKLIVPGTGNNVTLRNLDDLATYNPAWHVQNGEGAFRISCKTSHMLPDDPLVFPGLQGAAHLHTFFNNTSVNAFTNLNNVQNQGSATCSIGTGNRSSYWVPTMIDAADGTPIAPTEIFIYYKSGPQRTNSAALQPFPVGLRMISGDPTSNGPVQRYDYFFACNTPGLLNIPMCAQGQSLFSTLTFPQCWNGTTLDSANHRSHMASVINVRQSDGTYRGVCPTTHPVLLPQLTYILKYNVTKPEGTLNWRLSSDAYPKVDYNSGYSYHGDVVFGWKPAIMNNIIVHCLRKDLDCNGVFELPIPTP